MKVLSGQSILDIAIQSCGGAEAAFELSIMNGLNLTDNLVTGQELMLPDVVNPDITLYFKNKNIQPATLLSVQAQVIGSVVDTVIRDISTIQSNLITIVEGQTLFDIAIQVSGSAEAAFEMALINSIGITDELTPGMVLSPAGIFNKQIASYYHDKQIKPATSIVTVNASESGIFDYTFDFTFN